MTEHEKPMDQAGVLRVLERHADRDLDAYNAAAKAGDDSCHELHAVMAESFAARAYLATLAERTGQPVSDLSWADLPWRAATGWLRSASGSKIAEVFEGGGLSQRESELIAAAVNAYAHPDTDSALLGELRGLVADTDDGSPAVFLKRSLVSIVRRYEKGEK